MMVHSNWAISKQLYEIEQREVSFTRIIYILMDTIARGSWQKSMKQKFGNPVTRKRKITLMTDFIDVKFGYYPLVFMFYGRILNRKIDHLQEC